MTVPENTDGSGCGCTTTAAPGAGTWSLHLLDAARFPLAQCLDGSYGAFYVSPGSGAMASTFVLHFQGAASAVRACTRFASVASGVLHLL